MIIDTEHCHTKNGLVQNTCMIDGFSITVSIATGVAGESSCLIIHDTNLYPDGDSRGDRYPEFIIPITYVDDLLNLSKIILESVQERNSDLVI